MFCARLALECFEDSDICAWIHVPWCRLASSMIDYFILTNVVLQIHTSGAGYVTSFNSQVNQAGP